MTTITVTAADTAQAMDKIVERLGDDALILETVKRNGRIEMVATNDPDDAQTPAPASNAAQSAPTDTASAALDVEVGSGSPFTDLFDQQMINTIRDRGQPAATAADHFVGRANEAAENIDVLTELRSIRQMLGGMMITRPEGLDVTLGHAAPVRLHQAGFSSAAMSRSASLARCRTASFFAASSLTSSVVTVARCSADRRAINARPEAECAIARTEPVSSCRTSSGTAPARAIAARFSGSFARLRMSSVT